MSRAEQTELVRGMLSPERADGPMYWLRLVLAMAIATLGLVLGSTAVIIGAMLISPLMAPIVDLGMALAVGLPALAMRSFLRVLLSVVVVVASSTLITLALPFEEVTAPIAERAAPTVLDLSIAVCCALMAAFAAACSTRAAATTASGTAIAIALVPPLCVVGFGIGAGRFEIAGGAGLLFTANFSAIMFVAVLVFTAFGFADIELGALANDTPKRIGAFWRLVLPLVLLGVVFVPLRSALADVAWEVRARNAVRRELDAVATSTVRSQVNVSRHRVDVELVVLGDPARARGLERELTNKIGAVTGVRPKVSVLAVPDTDAMRKALEAAARPRAEPAVASVPVPVRARAAEAIGSVWPSATAGTLVGWRLDFDAEGRTRIDVAHLGDALGGPGRELLARQLEESLGAVASIVDHPLPRSRIECAVPADAACLARLDAVASEAGTWEALRVCATRPASELVDASAEPAESVAFSATVMALPDGRGTMAPAESWSLSLQTEPCPAPSAADAGVDASVDAGADAP